MKTLLAIATVMLALSSVPICFADSVSCTGADSKTGALIAGNCLNGLFQGVDMKTNAKIYGTCSAGSTLFASDSETHATVSGTCAPEL